MAANEGVTGLANDAYSYGVKNGKFTRANIWKSNSKIQSLVQPFPGLGTVPLLGSGLVDLGLRRWRKRNKAEK